MDCLSESYGLNDGFPMVCDGGCGIMVVVFDADTKRVIDIRCHGVA